MDEASGADGKPTLLQPLIEAVQMRRGQRRSGTFPIGSDSGRMQSATILR